MNRIEYKILKITFILLLLSIQLYAQNKLETPKRALVDQSKLKQCKKEVDEIKSIPLKCDTLIHEGLYVPSELYFDNQGRLRKLFYCYKWESENDSCTAYYNENGKLVYIEDAGGTNCTDEEEYFYLHDGRIVDYGFYYSCDCCEEDEQNEIDAKRPTAVGNLYADTREFGKNYISTESVFHNYYNAIDRLGNEQFNLMQAPPKIIPKMDASDIRYYESLQALPPYIMRDSIDNPKAYILQYYHEANTVIAIKKENQYLVFSIVPPSGYTEYEIVRKNMDGVGSDELIIRLKYREELEYVNYDTKEKQGHSIRQSSIMVWCLDTYSCLLNLYLAEEFIYWRYDNSGGKKISESNCHGYEVGLDKKQLSVQGFSSGYEVNPDNKQLSNRKIRGCEGCKKVILEQKHIYKLTESGFELNKVEK